MSQSNLAKGRLCAQSTGLLLKTPGSRCPIFALLLTGNRAYPRIVTDFRTTFAKLARMKADIVLTSHPDMSDMFAREGKAQAGNAGAFVDPAQLGKIVSEARSDFETELAKANNPTP